MNEEEIKEKIASEIMLQIEIKDNEILSLMKKSIIHVRSSDTLNNDDKINLINEIIEAFHNRISEEYYVDYGRLTEESE